MGRRRGWNSIYKTWMALRHPGNISPPSRSTKLHLSSIQASSQSQVSRCVSHLHPGPFSTGELYLSSILVPYNPIHVSRCATQLNPGPISTSSRSRDFCLLSTQAPRLTFLLCPSWISLQSGSWYLHIAYIQVTSQLHLGPPTCILVPSKHHINPIQCISPPTTSMYCLTSIQIHRFPFHLHPGRVSPPCSADIRASLILAGWNRTFITFCKGHRCSSIT